MSPYPSRISAILYHKTFSLNCFSSLEMCSKAYLQIKLSRDSLANLSVTLFKMNVSKSLKSSITKHDFANCSSFDPSNLCSCGIYACFISELLYLIPAKIYTPRDKDSINLYFLLACKHRNPYRSTPWND